MYFIIMMIFFQMYTFPKLPCTRQITEIRGQLSENRINIKISVRREECGRVIFGREDGKGRVVSSILIVLIIFVQRAAHSIIFQLKLNKQ